MSMRHHATVFECDNCPEIYIHAPTHYGTITPSPQGWWVLNDSDNSTSAYTFCSTSCLMRHVEGMDDGIRDDLTWEQHIAST